MGSKLKKNVELLLANSNIKFVDNGNYSYSNQAMLSAFGEPSFSGIVTLTPKDYQLDNDHAISLIKLSQQISESELKALDKLLLSKIFKNNPYGMVDAVTLYFIHTGKGKLLVKHIIKVLTTYNQNNAYLRCLEIITESLKHRPDVTDKQTVEFILDYTSNYLNGKNSIGKDARGEYSTLYKEITKRVHALYVVVNEILVKAFVKQIDTAYNPELNVDEEKVVEQIEAIGFPLDLSEQLRHISDLIDRANDSMQYRDVMSAIRVFTERLYEQVAKVIEPTTKVDGKDAEEVAKLFKNKNLLSTDMAELLKAHRHFLSNDGIHRIKSRKEDSRIAKNITIELSLYIITRLRELQEKSTFPQA